MTLPLGTHRIVYNPKILTLSHNSYSLTSTHCQIVSKLCHCICVALCSGYFRKWSQVPIWYQTMFRIVWFRAHSEAALFPVVLEGHRTCKSLSWSIWSIFATRSLPWFKGVQPSRSISSCRQGNRPWSWIVQSLGIQFDYLLLEYLGVYSYPPWVWSRSLSIPFGSEFMMAKWDSPIASDNDRLVGYSMSPLTRITRGARPSQRWIRLCRAVEMDIS